MYCVHLGLCVIQLYRSFEESSLINIVENYNHHLAEIGSHSSSHTLDQIRNIFGSEYVRSEYRWFEFTSNKELSSKKKLDSDSHSHS